MAPFEPGDCVVCVDTAPRGKSPYEASLRRLRKGRPYRVSDCSRVSVWLDECPSSHPNGGWQADRFRKIDDEVTEAFRETLRALPATREPANA